MLACSGFCCCFLFSLVLRPVAFLTVFALTAAGCSATGASDSGQGHGVDDMFDASLGILAGL